MPEFKTLENIYILLSHRDFYGTQRTAAEILGPAIDVEILSQLSVLSFSSNEEQKFRSWTKSNLPHTSNRLDNFDHLHIYGRAQILECWKLMLANVNRPKSHTKTNTGSLGILHELLTHINDYEVRGDNHQHLIKSAITHARDDFKFKLYRAHKIFLEGPHIARHVHAFQKSSGFSVEAYINIVYMILIRCYMKQNTKEFSPTSFSGWVIDLREASRQTGIDLQLLITVMKSISFDLQEGAEFATSTADELNNHNLFRDKPFLRLSEAEYLPVEGRFIEELLFDNLFHKVHLASGRSKDFLDDFGADFERYVQNLCEESCSLKATSLYQYLPEFFYGKTQSKSPDAMILCPQDNTLLALEVKASRYLDSLISTDNNTDAIENSFRKLRYGPWKQAHTALERIVREKRHPKITEGLSCLFISVTMNEIPLSLEDHKITVSDRDISYCFYSLGIHALELLLSSATMQDSLTLYKILRNAYDYRHKISTKTFLLRFYKSQNKLSVLDLMVAEYITGKHRKFMGSPITQAK